jgi:Xaa-Pro aminopeptidase
MRDASELLEDALELADLAEEMMEQRLRRERPGASDAEVDRALGDWLAERPGAPHGDAWGTVVTLPRRK